MSYTNCRVICAFEAYCARKSLIQVSADSSDEKPFLSLKPIRRPTSLVAIVIDKKQKKWILRVSRNKTNHRPLQFIQKWSGKRSPFLPAHMSCDTFVHKHRSFIIEKYEILHGAQPLTDSLDESTQFLDLHSFLDHLLRNPNPEGTRQAFTYLYQAAAGIAELHAESWFHFDISTENMAIDETGRCVNIDYEGTLHVPTVGTMVKQEDAKQSWKIENAPPELFGPPGWIDPVSVDCWALGVAIFQVACFDTPFRFEDENGCECGIEYRRECFDYIAEHGFCKFVESFKPWAYEKLVSFPDLPDLMEKIFIVYEISVRNYEELMYHGSTWRLTVQEVCDHPFFEEYKAMASRIVTNDVDVEEEKSSQCISRSFVSSKLLQCFSK